MGPNLPKLQETEFEWIIAGSVRTTETTNGTMVFFVQLSNNELLEQTKQFWYVEHLTSSFPLSEDEIECEILFKQTTYRQEDRRFVVSLPFKKELSG